MMQKKRVVFFLTFLGSISAQLIPTTQLHAPVSVGELIDKITILEIKTNTITNPEKLANVQREKKLLTSIVDTNVAKSSELTQLIEELFKTNKKLWDIEDAIREKEAKKQFDDEFIALARSVYFTNDHRGKLKYAINQLTESSLIEEKQYAEYQ